MCVISLSLCMIVCFDFQFIKEELTIERSYRQPYIFLTIGREYFNIQIVHVCNCEQINVYNVICLTLLSFGCFSVLKWSPLRSSVLA